MSIKGQGHFQQSEKISDSKILIEPLKSEEMYVDWYFTTGNHDWDDGNGTAQIAYSYVLKSKI